MLIKKPSTTDSAKKNDYGSSIRDIKNKIPNTTEVQSKKTAYDAKISTSDIENKLLDTIRFQNYLICKPFLNTIILFSPYVKVNSLKQKGLFTANVKR